MDTERGGFWPFVPFSAAKIKDRPQGRDGLRAQRPFVCVCKTSKGCVRRYCRRRRAGGQDGRSRRAIVRSRAAASGGSSTTKARSSGRGSAAGVPDFVPGAGGFCVSRPESCGRSVPRGGITTALSLGIPRERAWSFCGRRGGPKLGSRSRYFFAAGVVLSCFGFMPFLSFFCELLPLPMLCSLTFEPASRLPAGLPALVKSAQSPSALSSAGSVSPAARSALKGRLCSQGRT